MKTIQYKLGKRLLFEYVTQIMLKKTLLFGLIVGIVGALLFSQVFPNTFFFVVSLICLVLTVILPPITVWDIQRRDNALTGEHDAVTTLHLGETIQMEEVNFNLEINYDQIQRVLETKNLYAFMMGRSNGIIIPKDTLTEAAYQFIMNKIRK